MYHNYKMIIAYDGTSYNGWQRLKNPDITIQGKLEQVLSRMTGSPIEVIGSGRTDKGVHAIGQTANFCTEFSAAPEEIQSYMNTYLPRDIVVKHVEEVDPKFHARFNVKSKTYLYRIWNDSVPNVFERKYALFYPKPLDIEKMREGASLMCGCHDFRGFSSDKRKDRSTVRNLFSAEIERNDGLVTILFKGDGFLYNMARILAGTLVEIGAGIRPVETIFDVFNEKKRELAGPTLAPHGLFLYEVEY